MTNQEASKIIKDGLEDMSLDFADEEQYEALTMAIKTLDQETKWDRLYSWLNDMRLGIAPDETVTDIDERNVRTAQVDLLDEIMEWMVEQEERDKG